VSAARAFAGVGSDPEFDLSPVTTILISSPWLELESFEDCVRQSKGETASPLCNTHYMPQKVHISAPADQLRSPEAMLTMAARGSSRDQTALCLDGRLQGRSLYRNV
jgi:hypothetical protein